MKTTWLRIGLPGAVTYAFAVSIGAAFGWHSNEAFAADMLAFVSSAYVGGMIATVAHIRHAERQRARDIAADLMTRPPIPQPRRSLGVSAYPKLDANRAYGHAPPIMFGTLNELLGPLAAAYQSHSLDTIHGVRTWSDDRTEIVQCSPICIVAQDLRRLRAGTAAANAALAEDTMRLAAIRPMHYGPERITKP